MYVKLLILICSGSFIFSQDQGLTFYRNGEYASARFFYESILEKNNKNSIANYGIGTCAYSQQDYEAALNAFDNALETAQNNLKSRIYYNMGNTLFESGRKAESLAFFRKALELDPGDIDAKYNYEFLKYEQDREQDQENKKSDNSKNEDKKQKSDHERQDREKQNDGENNSENNKHDNGSEAENNQENSEHNQSQEPSPSEQDEEQDRKGKQKELRHAQSILDALKQDEKIHQKQEISRLKSKKFAKDW